MTDSEILFRWRRMPKDYQAIKIMAQLSDRKITDIIKLLNRSGAMVKWRNHDDDDGVMHKVLPMDTLDKIRAEIKALSNVNPSYWHSGDMVEREEVFEIIDKYREDGEL